VRAIISEPLPFRKSTLKQLEHALPSKSSRSCPKLSARVSKIWSAFPRQNECRVNAP